MIEITLFFRGFAVGLIVLIAAALARPGAAAPARLWGALFAVSVVGFIVSNSPPLMALIGPLGRLMWLLSATSTGFFTLFARAILLDREGPDRWGIAALAAFALICASAVVVRPSETQPLWMAHQAIEFICYGHVMWLAVAGWRGDLVENRRQFRGPLMAIVAVYGLFQGVFESIGFFVDRPLGYEFGESIALASVALWVALSVLQMRWDFIRAPARAEAPAPAQPDDGLSPADRIDLAKVLEIVDQQKAYREEGLTIGALADKARIPEHRLRRLINQGLGFRNYAAFLNARRLAEAKTLLGDATQARTPILTLALGLGYGSIGPFNRAFKEETGQTPSEWRAEKLRETAPISK